VLASFPQSMPGHFRGISAAWSMTEIGLHLLRSNLGSCKGLFFAARRRSLDSAVILWTSNCGFEAC
jgi:hypothetical protein